MDSLTVLDFAGNSIRFERRGDRLWVSLTDMAKATGKQVGHWNALSGTTEYLVKLESIIGIPIVLSNPGGKPETTGTWAIEEVAIKFAMWCNIEFEIWVTQQIRKLMTEGTVSIIAVSESAPQLQSSKITPAKVDLIRSAMSSVPTSLVDGFILNRIQYHHPELKADIEAAHSLLAATNSIPEVLLTPTAIGERLGVSARVINTLLIKNGYQTKNHGKSKTEPAYLPTELGKRYSSNTLATGKGRDNTSYQHTKWQESIVEVMRGFM
jgi:hypothetical protein